MTFEEYMDSNIPNWKTDVSIEEIENLEQLFKEVNDWQRIADNIFNTAIFNNQNGIDYSIPYTQANMRTTRFKFILENCIKEIRQNLGLKPTQKVGMQKKM